ncbi:MAG: SusD/RagB family nutrient-binding outer membrane lipoprotein [Saprospiraceae bacterium]
MKKIINLFLLTCCLFVVSSCDLELQEDPNNLSPESANVDFLLNSIEWGLNEFFFELTDYSMEVVRMVAMEPRSGTYETAYQPQDFDDMWEQAYVGILSDAKTLIPLAEEKGLFIHAGIARTIEAYTLVSLVDFFGDVPMSTALDSENFTPKVDEGAAVFAAAEELLDQAINDFSQESLGAPANDLFYKGDAAKWIALANSLKLKLALTTRLVDSGAAGKINALIAGDKLIKAASGDWDFPFSTNTTTTPDSRHPYFGDNYGGAADYMSNYYMDLLLTDKSEPDPRTRYYFYRQTLNISTDVNELPCIVETKPGHYTADMVFCNAGNGYWGRDNGDQDGIPPDNQLRTVFGLYPVGGKFDADEGKLATFGDGLQGAGIHPLMQSSWVKFMLAESALILGTDGDPADLLKQAVEESLDKVLNFGPAVTDKDLAPSVDDVAAYVDEVMTNYNAATTDDARLNIIVKEYYIALFGNGMEAYNAYRRTGKPDGMQLHLSSQPGPFIRSFAYPSNSINRNANISSKGTVGAQVFWDNNPADFVK